MLYFMLESARIFPMNAKLHIFGLIVIVFELQLFNSMTDEEWLLLSQSSHDNIADKIEECNKGEGYVRIDDGQQHVSRSLMEMTPPTLLGGFDNPCWIECLPADKKHVYPRNTWYWKNDIYQPQLEALAADAETLTRTWRLRCLPKFYLIGLAKCGTTDLFARIIKHPDIVLMGGKEVQWWRGHSSFENDIYDLERYLDVGDIPAQEILHSIRTDVRSGEIRHPVIFGDGTPGIIFSNNHWKRYVHTDEEETVLTPKFLSHIQPSAKIIAILRNPATMTFSSYRFFDTHVPHDVMSVEHFHTCVVESIESLRTCAEYHPSENYCIFVNYHHLNITDECMLVARSLQRGHYHVYLQLWMNYFPREQMMILRMEDYVQHQNTTINDVYTFLGVPIINNDFLKYATTESNVGHNIIGHMMAETVDLLDTYFEHSNFMLAELLDDEAYLWKDN